ncbi:MAG: hypothetical protein ACE14S_08880 [Candidatus Bathyarchaeia archaeon]
MSFEDKSSKKSKTFKQVIEEENNKKKLHNRVMRRITSINASLLYSLSFLLPFVTVAALVYYLLSPSVAVWALLLVVVAGVCSVFASYFTKAIKKKQWLYASRQLQGSQVKNPA